MQFKKGLTLGIWIKDSYYDASGLSSLNERKSALDNSGKREFESKMHTATAFMLFLLPIIFCIMTLNLLLQMI